MCGIFGYLTTDPSRGGAACLQDATRRLRHRGPDDAGTFEATAGDERCGLAHTRLAILDLSAAGHQPMATADGRYVITYNGEVYNFAELRAELAGLGERFTSASDTEVVLRAYARWGPACLDRLRGMFALGIWDGRERTLFLARDRLGIKPLYHVEHRGGLAFASEVRPLLESGFAARRLSPQGVMGYLAFGSVQDPDTLVEGVRALPPGCFLMRRAGRTTVTPYWRLPVGEAGPGASRPQGLRAWSRASGGARPARFDEAAEEVRALLTEAVRLRLIADVPVGVFLSGGIDSTAIVALATRVSGRPVHSFTVTFDEERFSEAPHAAAVAARFGCVHRQLRLPASVALGQLDRALGALDQPSVDGLNTYFVSEAVAGAGLRVALSGLGGDEVFAGYPSFRIFGRLLGLSRLARAIPGRLREAVVRGMDGDRRSNRARKVAGLLAAEGDPGAVYAVLRGVLSPDQRRGLLAPDFLARAPAPAASVPEGLVGELARGGLDAVGAYSLLELSNYLRNTLLRDADGMSMAHSLEVRVPLLDHRLVEAALRFPGALKVRPGAQKPLLGAAVEGLPADVLRRRKMGFTLPFETWLRGPLRGWMEQLLTGPAVARSGLLRASGVEQLWRSFLRGDRYVSFSRVWCVAALVRWCETHRLTL